MAYVIAQPCIGVKDTACVVVCPVDCIHPTPDEGGFAAAEQLYVNPDPCIDCGLCAAECPVNAVFQDGDLPAEWQEFIDPVPAVADHHRLGRLADAPSLRLGPRHPSLRTPPRSAWSPVSCSPAASAACRSRCS